ncbi:hypothetical protein ASE74_01115 [Pedobacter sp. Leaf216]|uniref:hypothetical protein n=1 Tax=Pedobacter sp. Leaf216 TaxID=1735684 RepID=UPI0006F64667|nr:hypothetical protein [Pedobacter sp. Leaf216]KQM79199.1 hypothetical protein ASE74_01115 [Pedobacter sp. Leaf216]
MVQINFQLNLSNDEELLLSKILKCTQIQLPDNLSRIGNAALNEYVKMFTGDKVFTRGKDMLEYRLINLIQSYYQGRIPAEDEISGIFQTSQVESRTMLKAISSKYQYILEAVIKESLKNKLDIDARKNGNSDFRISIDGSFFRDGYNKILARVATHAPLVKDNTTTSVYIIKNGEYAYLCNQLGIQETVNAYV